MKFTRRALAALRISASTTTAGAAFPENPNPEVSGFPAGGALDPHARQLGDS